MQGFARVPGTCGELAQGLIGDRILHITCPIDAWVTAEVMARPGNGRISGLDNKPKTEQALRQLLRQHATQDKLSETLDLTVTLTNPLPGGKGLASSSADICAACSAVASALGIVLSPELLGAIAVTVEPTDGLFYPGIAIYDHRGGTWGKVIGYPPTPPLHILVYDSGGTVDTTLFNRRPDLPSLHRANAPVMREAFRHVVRGLRQGNGKEIARGATISALANQRILMKTDLQEVIAGTAELGAWGVNVAHSGTVVGIWLPEERIDTIRRWMEIERTGWAFLGVHRLVSGGVRA
ncbi:GHMP kinase [Heliophilum fasciatum]|uniref:Threonine kinase n=1 Tax=Heliophilum fasciatum TaxID=35700 RepID=A0A4R2RLK2_9FIRM|nr:GHMP kinase [Heliophilum fasciatum]MCW2278544.1 L-threonine kinase [Heliophilum fasciatum]TCP63499.1 threonine kinase [Heliophilum fasciatum]